MPIFPHALPPAREIELFRGAVLGSAKRPIVMPLVSYPVCALNLAMNAQDCGPGDCSEVLRGFTRISLS